MSSSKNHTKNQLARISAKIQQLKRKYPVGPQLYISQQKDCHRVNDNALQEIRISVNNQSSHPPNQRIIGPKSISHGAKNIILNQKNFSVPQSYESSHRDSLQQQVQLNSSLTNSVKNINQSKQVQHFFQSQSVQSQSFDMNFMREKPYKEYKQELKHLKNEILSGLDISNFPIKRENQIKNPTMIYQANEQLNRKSVIKQNVQRQKTIINKENQNKLMNYEPKRIKSAAVTTTIQQIEEYKNRLINQNKTKKQHNNNDTKQIKTDQQLKEMREQIKRLNRQLHEQRCQFMQRLSKLQLNSHSIEGQTQQLRNELKMIQQRVLQSQQQKQMIENKQNNQQKKLSQYDFRIVQIQNQSITRLSKDIYKQIQSINEELNNIKQIQFTQIKSNNSTNQNYQQQIEQNHNLLISNLSNNINTLAQTNQQRIKQLQTKLFRQMFDIKNQIQLLNQKLVKQNYLQKTIKQLLPNNNINKQPNNNKINKQPNQIQQISSKVKLQLTQDKQFLINNIFCSSTLDSLLDKKLSTFDNQINKKLSTFDNQINKKLSTFDNLLDKKLTDNAIIKNIQTKINTIQKDIKQQLQKKIQKSNIQGQINISQSQKKTKHQINTFFNNQFTHFSTSLKQLETKMTSYGILIQHLEQTMKQLSLQVHSNINQIKPSQNQTLYNETKQITSLQTQNIESISLTSIQNHQLQVHKSQYAKSQLEHSKTSHITLPYCHVQQTKKQQDQFFITKLEQSKMTQIKHSQKGFLLDDLIKNSLVFSALNN